ncbi:hypothetical protein GE21DRAFT_1209190, partial [Neurospora crassa]
SRTLNISNLDNEEALNNINKAILTTIAKYYSKKGKGPAFAFRPLTKASKDY